MNSKNDTLTVEDVLGVFNELGFTRDGLKSAVAMLEIEAKIADRKAKRDAEQARVTAALIEQEQSQIALRQEGQARLQSLSDEIDDLTAMKQAVVDARAL